MVDTNLLRETGLEAAARELSEVPDNQAILTSLAASGLLPTCTRAALPACPRSSLADVVLCGRVVSPQEVHVCLPDLCKSRYNAGDLEQAIAPVVKKAAHRPPGEADPQFRPFRGQPRLCCACPWRLAHAREYGSARLQRTVVCNRARRR